MIVDEIKIIDTGEDENNLLVLFTKDETIERKSKVVLYEEIIESLGSEVIKDDNTIGNKIKELDEEIKVFEKKYAISNQKFQEDDRQKKLSF